MMETWLRYTVLPVGQGAGVLVQTWQGNTQFKEDSSAKPIKSALIDLGSLGWRTTAGAQSALFVATQLKKMSQPRLDAVFLSHSDLDHTNLLKKVFDAFAPPEAPPTVGQVWFGGNKADYARKSPDPLALLKSYGADLQQLSSGASSWPRKGIGPPIPLCRMDDVLFWLLIGNTQEASDEIDDDPEPDAKAVDDPPRGAKRPRDSDSTTLNVVSLVIITTYGSAQEQKLISTGDATGLTLSIANREIRDHRISMAPVLTLSLPHHGSEASTYNLRAAGHVKRARPDATAEAVVREFVSHLSPRSITASAGEHKTYFHPASRVIADFAWPTESGMYEEEHLADQHFFTAYYQGSELDRETTAMDIDDQAVESKWPGKKGWYTGRTERNVFTIDYASEDPRGLDLPAVSYAFSQAPQAKPVALFDGGGLTDKDELPPRAAGWGYYVSSDGGKTALRRLVDIAKVKAQALAALEAVHGPLPPERFVFLPSAPASTAESPPPPTPAVVPEAPRTRAPTGSTRPPRQLP